MDEQPEVTEETELSNYAVKAYMGLALTVQDAKSEDYVDGFVRATLLKEYPQLNVLDVKISKLE